MVHKRRYPSRAPTRFRNTTISSTKLVRPRKPNTGAVKNYEPELKNMNKKTIQKNRDRELDCQMFHESLDDDEARHRVLDEGCAKNLLRCAQEGHEHQTACIRCENLRIHQFRCNILCDTVWEPPVIQQVLTTRPARAGFYPRPSP